jgi:hypothetical protein
MSITERSEIVAALYRAQAQLAALYQNCLDARALHIGVSVQAAQNCVNEAIADFRPDAPDYVTPPAIELPRSKF